MGLEQLRDGTGRFRIKQSNAETVPITSKNTGPVTHLIVNFASRTGPMGGFHLLPDITTVTPLSNEGAVIVNGREIPLRPKETNLLGSLVSQPGSVISQERLIVDVWGEEQFDRANLPDLVLHLRRRVEPNPEKPIIIQGVRGEGYRFGDPIDEVEPDRTLLLVKDIAYTLDQKKIVIDGEEKKLSRSEKDLLDLLIEFDHGTVSAEEISERVWPGERFILVRVSSLVKKLRHKVEPDPNKPILILRIRGEGYRLADFDPNKEKKLALEEGQLKYSEGHRRVDLNGNKVLLTEKEHAVFMALCHHAGEIVLHDAIIRKAWDDDVSAKLVNQLINKLSKKIKINIRSFYGRGYMLDIISNAK